MESDHRLKSVPPDADDLIVVAHIAKTRGLRGEVVADLLTDFPERFENLKSLVGLAADGLQRCPRRLLHSAAVCGPPHQLRVDPYVWDASRSFAHPPRGLTRDWATFGCIVTGRRGKLQRIP